MGGWKLGHRPALDGLRGVAILLVVAAHANLPGMSSGGSIGVVLFFVLSGFLITSLLLEERTATGAVRLRRFYARRTRRLAPAFVVMVAAVALARFALGPWVLDWSALPAVLLYVGNWVPLTGGSLGVLGATWTLSVEEQFYLLWPLAVWCAATRSRVVLVATVLAAASLMARVVLLASGAPFLRLATGSDVVAFALLVGGILAGLRMAGGPGRSSPVAAGLGFGVVGVGLAWFTMGSWAVLGLPMVSAVAAVIVWACTGSGGVRFLEWRWLRWFGSRSYGIYLWHAPVLAAMATHYALPWPVLLVVGVPVSLVLAEVSFRWVEAPFRARRNAPRPAEAEQGASRVGAVSG